MKYKVTKQYGRGPESPCAQFDDISDAKQFIQLKLEQDASMKVSVTYKLLQAHEVLEEFAPGQAGSSTANQSQDSQGQSSSSTARPSPFSTVPRPSGMPSKWSSNKDDEEKK